MPAQLTGEPSSVGSYPLSLHDALPICLGHVAWSTPALLIPPHNVEKPAKTAKNVVIVLIDTLRARSVSIDRKSTRLNSSHGYISYAVFCLKKKKKIKEQDSYRDRTLVC